MGPQTSKDEVIEWCKQSNLEHLPFCGQVLPDDGYCSHLIRGDGQDQEGEGRPLREKEQRESGE